jgi:hypothetical protein
MAELGGKIDGPCRGCGPNADGGSGNRRCNARIVRWTTPGPSSGTPSGRGGCRASDFVA